MTKACLIWWCGVVSVSVLLCVWGQQPLEGLAVENKGG